MNNVRERQGEVFDKIPESTTSADISSMQLKLSLFCSNIVVDKPNLSFGSENAANMVMKMSIVVRCISSLNY